MTQSLQCPKCGGSTVSQEGRRRNPKSGNSVGTWFLGCLVQLALVSGVAAAIAFALRVAWPGQPFAEAALLSGTIAAIYLVGVGIMYLGLRRWPLTMEGTCGACGHKWVVDMRPESPGFSTLHEGKPNT